MSIDFKIVKDFPGYIAKRESTNVEMPFLIRGSKNVLIDDSARISSRRGYTLYGAAKTINNRIRSSYEWQANTNLERALRSYKGELEVYAFDSWRRIKNGWGDRVDFSFAPWWSNTEQIDFLLFVNGTDKIYDWSGAISKVASVTSTTIKKMFTLTGTTYAFVAGSSSVPPKITDSASGFVTAGFAVGDRIVVSGSASNDGTYMVLTVAAGTIELVLTDNLTTEAAGASVNIAVENKATWAEERALANGTRKFTINSVEYTYTGGETTDTLTGVTPSPVGVVNNGDVAIQTIRENDNEPVNNAKNDFIEVLENQLYIGNKTGREVYISQDNDFKDFTFSGQRAPGEGGLLTLDNPPTAFIPQEGEMYIGAGKKDFYQVVFALSSDNQYEAVNIKKLKTSEGQAPLSQSAVTNIKNSVAFITNEPTLDTLGRIQDLTTPQSKPLSDVIKLDFNSYDFTGAHIRYHRNNILIAIPNEGILLIYDIENGFWQPPQEINVSRIAIIDGELYGHSAAGNETYKLFDGYNDNGVAIHNRAVFAYFNYGSREKYKRFDRFYVETYMTQVEAEGLRMFLNYEFNGGAGVLEFAVDGTDPTLLFGADDEDASLGSSPLGSQPLGSQLNEPDPDLDGTNKYRVFFGMNAADFFEHNVVFEATKLDFRFKLVAFGPNATLSPNKPTYITK